MKKFFLAPNATVLGIPNPDKFYSDWFTTSIIMVVLCFLAFFIFYTLMKPTSRAEMKFWISHLIGLLLSEVVTIIWFLSSDSIRISGKIAKGFLWKAIPNVFLGYSIFFVVFLIFFLILLWLDWIPFFRGMSGYPFSFLRRRK